MKKLLGILMALAVAFTVLACTKESAENKIVIGVSPVPHQEIIVALQDEFKAAGLDVEVKVFDDYVQPNMALNDGDLDANFFQHKPYLESFAAERNLKLVALGKVHIEPMGFYSKKIKSLDELKKGDEILIPNDPSNGCRALLLLQEQGLLTLKDSSNLNSTEKDIIDNPKELKFTPIDAPNIANVYGDVAGGVINTNFALAVGLNPAEDALAIESKDSPYANLIAIRAEDQGKEKFKKLIEVLQSEKNRAFIMEKYNGSIFPAF